MATRRLSKENNYGFTKIPELEKLIIPDYSKECPFDDEKSKSRFIAEKQLSDFVKDMSKHKEDVPGNLVSAVFGKDSLYSTLINFGRRKNLEKQLVTLKRPSRFDGSPAESHYIDVAMILAKNNASKEVVYLALVHDCVEDFLVMLSHSDRLLDQISAELPSDFLQEHLHSLTNYYSLLKKEICRDLEKYENPSSDHFDMNLKFVCNYVARSSKANDATYGVAQKFLSIYDGLSDVKYGLEKLKQKVDQQIYPAYLKNIEEKAKTLVDECRADSLYGIYVKLADCMANAITRTNLPDRKKPRILYKSKAVLKTALRIKTHLENSGRKDELLDSLIAQTAYVSMKEFSSYLLELENDSQKKKLFEETKRFCTEFYHTYAKKILSAYTRHDSNFVLPGTHVNNPTPDQLRSEYIF